MRGLPELLLGAVLVGIGFATGESVFRENPSLLDACFDGLGLFFVGRGLWLGVRAWRSGGPRSLRRRASGAGARVRGWAGLCLPGPDPGRERDIIG